VAIGPGTGPPPHSRVHWSTRSPPPRAVTASDPEFDSGPDPGPEPRHGPLPEYDLRRSARAKRVTLRVSAGRGLVVSAPPRTSLATIEAVIAEHRDWARQALADCERAVPEACREWPPRRLELAAIGQRVVIGFEPVGSTVPPPPGAGDEPLLVLAIDPDDRVAVARAVTPWLRSRARDHLVPRLAVLARRHGAAYRRCTVRSQRSVWGSCSSSGTVSLNCALLFLAPPLVDYVLLHELAHTRHPDHSPRFWDLLERWLPGCRVLDRRLRTASAHVPPWLERAR